MAEKNPLPNWEEQPEKFVPLPLHVQSVDSHECVFCGLAPQWDDWAAYEAFFWAEEFEGDPFHGPGDQDEWEYVNASCLAA